jgi:nitronate monooxygenase
VIKQSPMYVSAQQHLRKPKCDKGYVLLKDAEGKFSRCPAKDSNLHHFCICNGLLSSAGYNADVEEPLYTVGTNASRVDRILPVRELMAELASVVREPLAPQTV